MIGERRLHAKDNNKSFRPIGTNSLVTTSLDKNAKIKELNRTIISVYFRLN